jgi:hypothetical protein
LNDLRKYIASIALVIALFAINGSEFLHHHEDEIHHDDSKCEACLFNKVIQSSALPSPSSDLNLYHSYNGFLSEETQFLPQKCYSNSSGRSPPEASHI